MNSTLIIGASGGIGAALASACRARGETVCALSRSKGGLEITDEDSVRRHLEGLGPFQRVIVATGALDINGAKPEKTIKTLSAQDMMAQFRLNAIGPALILSHAHHLLPRKGRSVFAVLSARVGSIGDNQIGGWISYRSAKAALNQILRTSAIELKRSHKDAICVALHPGTVATAFTQAYLGRHPAVTPTEAAGNLLRVMDGLTPENSGQFFDWAGTPVPW